MPKDLTSLLDKYIISQQSREIVLSTKPILNIVISHSSESIDSIEQLLNKLVSMLSTSQIQINIVVITKFFSAKKINRKYAGMVDFYIIKGDVCNYKNAVLKKSREEIVLYFL